jgi:hypothetical protein
VEEVLGNRKGECLSGTWLGSTQHPLYFFRTCSQNTVLFFFVSFCEKMLPCTIKTVD